MRHVYELASRQTSMILIFFFFSYFVKMKPEPTFQVSVLNRMQSNVTDENC